MYMRKQFYQTALGKLFWFETTKMPIAAVKNYYVIRYNFRRTLYVCKRCGSRSARRAVYHPHAAIRSIASSRRRRQACVSSAAAAAAAEAVYWWCSKDGDTRRRIGGVLACRRRSPVSADSADDGARRSYR